MWFGANDYMIDGITDLACCFSNQIVIAPNQDSVSEVKMSASNYDPEFGNSAGLIAQYVTKSGTNQIHGSVWWSNMNKATFAANPFTEKIAGHGPARRRFRAGAVQSEPGRGQLRRSHPQEQDVPLRGLPTSAPRRRRHAHGRGADRCLAAGRL